MGAHVDSRPRSARRWARAAAVVAVAAVAGVACTDDSGRGGDTSVTATPASTSTTTSTVPGSASTAPTDSASTAPGQDGTTVPGGEGTTTTSTTPVPGVELPPLLENDGGANDALTGVGRLTGQGSDCTAFLVDTGADEAPAFALTNGHCVGLFDNRSVIVDGPGGGTVAFNRFVDTDDVEVGIASVRWATMRGVDLAVLQLDTTLGDLRDQEVAAYVLRPFAPEATGIRIVGVPVTGVDPDEYYVRASDCAAGHTTRLLEFTWLWDAAQANDCDAIVGGNSGSPVFDPDGDVVGIVNTTTVAASPGGECYLGHPCEVTAAGAAMATATSYAMPVDGVAACFTAGGTFELGSCDLEAAAPPVTVTLSAPVQQSPAAWQVSIEGAAGTIELAGKAGPIGEVDCREAAGYQPIEPQTFQPAAPVGEGFHVACVATVSGGVPDTASSSAVILQVDDTPPVEEPELSIIETGDGGFRVEPIFATPELSDFIVKVGRFAATDCADPDGFVRYRRIPIPVAAEELPASVCVIGFDFADNPSPPVRFELD